MTRVYLFPGQGSQKIGMGSDLFVVFPEQVAIADRELGWSIQELCLADSQQRLNKTEFTQPALFVVNALAYLNRLAGGGEAPHFVAGHSLGEFNALFAAGVFNFETGLKLVKKRAALMSRATGGAMAAVIGLSEGKIRAVLGGEGMKEVDIANLNSPQQTVISGLEADITACQAVLEKAGAKIFKKLPVSGAFHSRYMAEAEREFAQFLESFEFTAPKFPVVANVTARPHESGQIKGLLARQITSPVRWTESILWLLEKPDPEFSELGPGNVLTGLLRRIKAESQPAVS